MTFTSNMWTHISPKSLLFHLKTSQVERSSQWYSSKYKRIKSRKTSITLTTLEMNLKALLLIAVCLEYLNGIQTFHVRTVVINERNQILKIENSFSSVKTFLRAFWNTLSPISLESRGLDKEALWGKGFIYSTFGLFCPSSNQKLYFF